MQQEGNQIESNPSDTEAKGKLYYGWVVAIAGAVAVMAASNFQYTFGIFVQPLIDKFGWSRAAISGCVSVRSIVSGTTAPVVGALSDKYGPRKFILGGIFLVGSGYLLASRITSLWHLYIFLSLFIGIGGMALFIPAVSIAAKWFGGKAALANGIVMSGFGLAQIILPPVATYIILKFGLEVCFIFLGIIAWVLGSTAWRFIRTPQGEVNKLQSESFKPGPPETGKALPEVNRQYRLSDILRSKTFWLLFVIFIVVAGCYQMIIIHIVAAAIDSGITYEAAAVILTLSGITCTVGRLAVGFVANKIGNKTTLSICLAIQALLLFPLAGASDLIVFYAVTAIYTLGYGAVTPLIPALAGEYFGTRQIGSIWGVLAIAYTSGAAIGPLLAGYIFDVTGSYNIAFLYSGVVMVVTLILSLALRLPKLEK